MKKNILLMIWVYCSIIPIIIIGAMMLMTSCFSSNSDIMVLFGYLTMVVFPLVTVVLVVKVIKLYKLIKQK